MYSQLYRYITSFSLVDFKDQFYIVQVLYHVQHSKPIDIEKQSSFYVFMNENYCNRIHIYEKPSTLPFYLWLLLPFVYHLLRMTVLLGWSYTEIQKYGLCIVYITTFNWAFAFLNFFFFNLKIYFPSVPHYKKINNYTVYILMNSNFLLTFKQNVCLKSSSIFKCLLKIKHTWLYMVFWYLFLKKYA